MLVDASHLLLDEFHLVMIPRAERLASFGYPEIAFQHFMPLVKQLFEPRLVALLTVAVSDHVGNSTAVLSCLDSFDGLATRATHLLAHL